jgi:hypothetical protein
MASEQGFGISSNGATIALDNWSTTWLVTLYFGENHELRIRGRHADGLGIMTEDNL